MIRRLLLAAALVAGPAVLLAQPIGPAHTQQQDTSKTKKPAPAAKKHKKAAKPAPKDTTKAK